MKNIKIRKSVMGIFSLVAAIAQTSCGQAPVPVEKPWPLTGQEVLLEISDPRGSQPTGIYAFDPLRVKDGADSEAPLRLLVKNASRPTWSPHHKRFAYLFNDQLWLCDLAGKKVAVSQAPPKDSLNANEGAVRWALNGTLFYSLKLPAWGAKTLIGIPSEDPPLESLRQSEDELFQNSFSEFIPLAHRDLQGLSSSKLKWKDVLSTNEASFSPDGLHIAVELYPSSPYDLRRGQSKIQIYDLFKWTTDAKANDVKMNDIRGWFGANSGYVSALGPGRRLTKTADKEDVEILPRWAPSGQWVAFTSIDLMGERVIPMVVRPDGTDLTVLALPSEGVIFNKWTPVTKADLALKTPLSKSTKVWGDVHRITSGWSSEGNYLWMNSGANALWVAKWENKKWVMRSVPITLTSEHGIKFWAYRGSKVVVVQDSGDVRKINEISIIDVEANKSLVFPLRSSLEVNSVSW